MKIDTYENFEQLMLIKILPAYQNNSSLERLDGNPSGGNRTIYAYFKDNDKVKWKIHSDTYFEELIKAYEDFQQGNNPFVILRTKRNKNDCLILRNDLVKVGEPKHIYIYKV